MAHPETGRLVPGAKCAVLFLHGIVGTPHQFRTLMPLEELVPADWSLFNIRYPGHGGDVRDFGKSSMDAWRTYARHRFLELAENHEKIMIVGHSMGTLFALQLALEFPEKVGGLLLLNVPLRPWMRLFCLVNCLRLAFGRIRQDHPWEAAFQTACGVTPTPFVWRYISWIPRLLELFIEIYRTETCMGNLKIPCIACQSGKDDLVSNLTTPVLRKSGVMEVHELPDSTHFHYTTQDKKRVCKAFETEMKKISG